MLRRGAAVAGQGAGKVVEVPDLDTAYVQSLLGQRRLQERQVSLQEILRLRRSCRNRRRETMAVQGGAPAQLDKFFRKGPVPFLRPPAALNERARFLRDLLHEIQI